MGLRTLWFMGDCGGEFKDLMERNSYIPEVILKKKTKGEGRRREQTN